MLCMIMLYTLGHGQPTSGESNCPGDKIRVFKGGIKCGCHCQKTCVSPAQLQQYLDDGWNTTGCFSCCWIFWVDSDDENIPESDLTVQDPDTEILTAYDDPTKINATIQVTDMAGRNVETVFGEFSIDEDIASSWDTSDLAPGIYFLHINAGNTLETKMISVTN